MPFAERHVRAIARLAVVLPVAAAFGSGCSDVAPKPARSAAPKPNSIKSTAFESPYRNTRPGVRYVGDDACAACHAEIAEAFHQHPMGRSLAPMDDADAIERFDEFARQPLVTGGFRYEVLRENGQIVHRQTRLDADGKEVASEEAPIAYAIGSGQRGRSYLINRDGYLFQSPITWYPTKGVWGLSPGYDQNNFGFHRPILDDCLFCHANGANPVEHTKNRYEEPIFTGYAIGCERCHGPGEPHVRAHTEGGVTIEAELTIVNPARLDPPLREAVCQQCHLAGAARVPRRGKALADFRPGLPLDSCIATYVLHPDLQTERHFVGQVEQMYQSRCFQASGGKFGCISCHNPHVRPSEEERVDFYRGRCMQCHQSQGCSLPYKNRVRTVGADDCVACHMPVLQTDVRHAATTDHRVVRRPSEPFAGQSGLGLSASDLDAPLIEFPPRTAGVASTERRRDLAIAMVQSLVQHPRAVTPRHLSAAAEHLQTALERDSDDLRAREALAQIYWKLRSPRIALALYEGVLAREPNREHSLVLFANALSAVGDADRAVARWQQAVELNPFIPQYQADLAEALSQAGRWGECLRVAQQGAEQFPLHVGLRQFLVAGLLQTGEVQDAEAEFAKLQAFDSPDLPAFRQWFESHPLRRRPLR